MLALTSLGQKTQSGEIGSKLARTSPQLFPNHLPPPEIVEEKNILEALHGSALVESLYDLIVTP